MVTWLFCLLVQMLEAENQSNEAVDKETREEEENMPTSDSSNDNEDTEQDTPPPLELEDAYELENRGQDESPTETEAQTSWRTFEVATEPPCSQHDRCGDVTDSGGEGADRGEELKECVSEEAGVPAGPEGGAWSGTTAHTSAHLSLERTQTQEAAAEDTAPGEVTGVDPAAPPGGRLSTSLHPRMDQTDRGENMSGVSPSAAGVTTEDVDPPACPPDAVAPPGEPLETDDLSVAAVDYDKLTEGQSVILSEGLDVPPADRANADDAQERDGSGESAAAPAVAEDPDADTREGVNDGVSHRLQTTGTDAFDADTLSDGTSLSPSVGPEGQTEDTDRKGTSEETRICAGDGEEAEAPPTDPPADILMLFSVEQQTDPTTNDDHVSTATSSSPRHLLLSEQQLSSSPDVESGISSLAVSPDLQDTGFDTTFDTTTAPRPEERPEDVITSVPHLVSSGSEQFAANEDPLGHEVEDGYQTAMAAFMEKHARTKEEEGRKEKVEEGGAQKKDGGRAEKKKAAEAEEEKDEDVDKTEISIMEATMDNNEWITDGNYQVLPWMNISAPAVTQDTPNNDRPPAGEQHPGSSLAAAPPPADHDPDGDQKEEEADQPTRRNVDVTFRIHYLTPSPHHSVAVTGNQQELGNWRGYVPLERAGAGHWAAVVGLPPDSHVEWKFVVVDRGQVCRWEECGNRLLDTGRGDELLVHKWWGVL